MYKTLLSTAIAAAISISLSGCVIVAPDHDYGSQSDWQKTQQENLKHISQLSLNTSRQSVLDKLGAPNISEAFDKNGKTYQVLYYRTQHRHSDSQTTKDETTPLVFLNDQLIGWGEQALSLIE